jgi:diguanylate cyclase (GGDEF)-like protein/PAS domain S-box-containing protein
VTAWSLLADETLRLRDNHSVPFYTQTTQKEYNQKEPDLCSLEFADVIVDTVDALILVLDCRGHIIRFNKACAAVLGYSLAEVSHAPIWETVAVPEDVPRLMAMFGGVQTFSFPYRRESVWITKDGRQELIAWTNTALRDAGGTVQAVIATGLLMTEQREAQNALFHAEQNYQSIFENAVDGIFQTTPAGHYLSANPSLARIYGYSSPEEMIESLRNITQQLYVNPSRRSDFIRLMQQQDSVSNFEAEITRRDGSRIWIAEHARVVRDSAGGVLYYEGTVQDITHRKELEAERERLLADALERADHDPLTGLMNHRAFQRRCTEEAARARREGTPLAVALVDVDNFTYFNDAHGHLTGDEVLKQIALTLQQHCRSYDLLARYGSDEFALLMPRTTPESAARLTSRLLQAVEKTSYRPVGSDTAIPLSLTLGLAHFTQDDAGHESILEAASSRLARMKSGGKGDEEIESLRKLLHGSFQGFSMLDALVIAVDNKDCYTRRHSEDVMRYALQIAQGMKMSQAFQRTIQIAALLHDVGKIGVPDRILRKPDRLTDTEFEAIRQHPLMGAVIVGAVPGFEETLSAIRHHHERWDGRGYPDGLRGEASPLPARIMAVADAYSAMTMDRPYRKGKKPQEALAVLADGAGSQWDPACVEAFLSARSESFQRDRDQAAFCQPAQQRGQCFGSRGIARPVVH